jgi:hypothetical protein
MPAVQSKAAVASAPLVSDPLLEGNISKVMQTVTALYSKGVQLNGGPVPKPTNIVRVRFACDDGCMCTLLIVLVLGVWVLGVGCWVSV